METLKQPYKLVQRNVISILETINVEAGERNILSSFNYLIEAPNWTSDGRKLIYMNKHR